MAEQNVNSLANIMAVQKVNDLRMTLQQRYQGLTLAAVVDDQLQDVVITDESFASLLITGINGDIGMMNQSVKVEYLRQDQRLLIPAAMAMNFHGDVQGWITRNAQLHERYWMIANIPYAILKASVTGNLTAEQMRTMILVGAEPMPVANRHPVYTAWNNPTWAAVGEGQVDDTEVVDIVMARVSWAMQFNCDIRDGGFLTLPNTTVEDNAWMAATQYGPDRLVSKLHPYTLQNVAALNMPAVNGYGLAAWVRAYGLSCGVLRSEMSSSVVEHAFVIRMPDETDRQKVIDYESTFTDGLVSMSMNIIAMFGVFHLSKDHTYRPQDPAMERIGESYIQTLRTVTNTTFIDQIKTQKEAIVRTAPHPFGLAQCYWAYRVMHHHDMLAPALEKRYDVSPPPVQRLMIVDAARKEWGNLPAGKLLNDVFAADIDIVAKEVIQIRANPPAYSALCALYGVPVRSFATEESKVAADAMMPCIYGFAQAYHAQDEAKKDGLALALSLNNIMRDQKALADTWKTLWIKYSDTMAKDDIVQFAKTAYLARNEIRIAEEAGLAGVEGATQ